MIQMHDNAGSEAALVEEFKRLRKDKRRRG
jgi:hypothetical protein